MSKKLNFTPQKLSAIFTNSKHSKTLFGKNSVTYETPCHAIDHFVFYYHHVTYRTPCHASGHLMIYRECYGFERAFFTLRSFLPYTPSCQFQGLPGAGSVTLNLAGFHADIFETLPRPTICLNHNNSQKIYSRQVYLSLMFG